MSAKSILYRYLVKTREHAPNDPSELRKHLASVAEMDRLTVTDEELDELAGIGSGDLKSPVPEKGAKSAPKLRRKSKSGDSTTASV